MITEDENAKTISWTNVGDLIKKYPATMIAVNHGQSIAKRAQLNALSARLISCSRSAFSLLKFAFASSVPWSGKSHFVHTGVNGSFISATQKGHSFKLVFKPHYFITHLKILTTFIPFKMIILIPEQHIERGQASVNLGNILLHIHFFFIRKFCM